MAHKRPSISTILDGLNLSHEDRKSVMRAARKRTRVLKVIRYEIFAAFLCVIYGYFALSWWALLASGLSTIIPWGLYVAMQIGFVVAVLYLTIRYMVPVSMPGYRVEVVRELVSRGYRFCRECGYDLRQLPADASTCPECSSFLSSMSPEQAEQALVPGVQQTDAEAHIRKYVCDVPSNPELIEQVLLQANTHAQRRKKRIGCVIPILVPLVFVGYMVALYSNPQRRPSPTPFNVSMLIPFGIICAVGVAISVIQRRRYSRDVRKAFCDLGVIVCLKCGQHLGENHLQLKICPKCNRRLR